MYSIIQFSDKHGGSVSIVNSRWFTPRRCEVFWPPVKGTKAFERVLAEANTPDNKWKLYSVQRVFGETDDIERAKKKLKLVEVTSDIQSETEVEGEPSGKRKRTKRSFSSSDEEPVNDNNIRPPHLKKKTLQKIQIASNSCLNSYYEDTCLAQSISLETPIISEKTISSPNLEVSKLPDIELQDLEEIIGEGQSTPVARPDTPRCQPSILPTNEPATPLCVQELTGYQKKVISLLSCIKVQNEQIISLITNTSTLKGTLKPELKFPLHNSDELKTIEELLQEKENKENLVSYMRTFGGRDISSRVSRIMKFCFTDQLAEQYNFYGKRSNKKAFCQLRLRECIVEAVVTTTGTTAKEVEDFIKIWLKHAPERVKKQKCN